ncbi:MAG TPA: tRNA (uridine(34)/cytosine(34)/5-carboxymethylaminomethyluridine(34)-2'-O)-methyltransferase TrmL, partial [Flavobacteriaceae bacterium]|nr:tRNA (uridine(34)/cytosine(34)/5-carboxymethylaminomethyluridine(34)-2'-O)-methyltransferase TrmL [Flavobacteriaceae bacterium]
MPFHVVLVHPEIPNNTGNIGRLCLGTGSELHLIKPLGFSLEDKQLKRSGLDYWPKLKVHIHEDFASFLAENPKAKMAFYSSKGSQTYWDLKTEEDQYFVFG